LVAVVVLNWDQEQDTAECLQSLRSVSGIALRIVLVDNGSKSGESDRLAQGFPEVEVLPLAENRGFAAGNNIGMAHAAAFEPTHILLLNNDTVVDPGFLVPLLGALGTQGIGIVGPKILYHAEPERIWFAGGEINWRTGKQYHLGAGEQDRGQRDGFRDVDYVSACCLMAPSWVFNSVGQLDERYFIYYEETDWNLRARAYGLRACYVPQARIWHKVSRAMGTASALSDYYYARNRLLFFQTHAPAGHQFRLIALYTLRSLRFAARLRGQGRSLNAKAVQRGVADFYLRRFGRCTHEFARPTEPQP
jgi:hypothetical protein